MWKFLNEILGKSRKKKDQIGKIRDNNVIIEEDNFSKSNAFNKSFVESIRLLSSQFPENNNAEHLSYIIECPTSMALFHATENEVFNLINGLQVGKSCGYDGISVFTVKKCAPTLTHAITVLFNLSLEKEIYPTKLKTAKVVPILKSGSKENMANYRPISLLPVFTKIFEKLLFKRMWNFLTQLIFSIHTSMAFNPILTRLQR
jgi:hypothetical protein